MNAEASLPILLRTLGLPMMEREHGDIITRAEQENWGYSKFLHHLAELEAGDKRSRRIRRLLLDSDLPEEFTLELLDKDKMPEKARRMLPTLLSGDWVKRGDNLIALGLHGRGKTAFCSAVGRALVERHQMKVLFVPTFKLVDRLLAARNDHTLGDIIERLNRYDVVQLDELGYLTQSRDNMDVLFNFIAERHQRKRSVMVTSNLVFSQWDQIFKDAMIAQAAVDRLVHRATIFEFSGPSWRDPQAASGDRAAA